MNGRQPASLTTPDKLWCAALAYCVVTAVDAIPLAAMGMTPTEAAVVLGVGHLVAASLCLLALARVRPPAPPSA